MANGERPMKQPCFNFILSTSKSNIPDSDDCDSGMEVAAGNFILGG